MTAPPSQADQQSQQAKALALLDAADEVCLACHVRPDADALGSMLAVAHALRAPGRRPQRVVASFGDEPFETRLQEAPLKQVAAETRGQYLGARKTPPRLGEFFRSHIEPLPGRLNIVVTRNPGYKAEGAEVVGSLGDAIRLAQARGRCMAGADAICVIGGGEIYAQALPLADRLHLTHVAAKPDGDTLFPPVDPAIWRPIRSEHHPAAGNDSHDTRYVVYERRNPAH